MLELETKLFNAIHEYIGLPEDIEKSEISILRTDADSLTAKFKLTFKNDNILYFTLEFHIFNELSLKEDVVIINIHHYFSNDNDIRGDVVKNIEFRLQLVMFSKLREYDNIFFADSVDLLELNMNKLTNHINQISAQIQQMNIELEKYEQFRK